MKTRVDQTGPQEPDVPRPPAATGTADRAAAQGAGQDTADPGASVSGIRGLVRAHQLAVFSVLAIAVAWWRLPFQDPAGGVMLDPWGPAVAAFVVVALSGPGHLRRFARQVADVRAAGRWFAIATLIPIAMIVGSVAVNTLLGAPAPTFDQLAGWTGLPFEFLILFVMVGVGEEIGWTTFGAPRALRGRGFLVAAALLGGMRVVWHLPLLVTGELEWIMVLGMVSFQVLILWMYVRNGGRWLPAALFHGVLNTVGGSFFFTMVKGADQSRLAVIFAGGYALLAIGVMARDRQVRGSIRPAISVAPGQPLSAGSGQEAAADSEPDR